MKKTLALLLTLVMIFALCAGCGGSKAEEAAPAAAPAGAAEAPAAPAAPEGEASEEGSGEPVAELFPADGFSKDLAGYKEYAIAALRSDEHAPPEIIESTIESINAAADGDDASFGMMIYQGRILSYEEFVG